MRRRRTSAIGAAVVRVVGAGAVEEAVAEHEPLDALRSEHASPPSRGAPMALPKPPGRRVEQRLVLGLHPRALRPIRERDALGDEPARARGAGGVQQVPGALGAAPVGGGVEILLAEVEPLGQRGELVNDDLGARLLDRHAQRVGVEHVHDGGARAGLAHVLGLRLGARHARHLVSGGDELRDQRPADRPARACDEHPHAIASCLSIHASSTVDERERDEVGGADPAGVGLADVDQVVERVERVLNQRQREHRHAPGRPADGHERHGAEREVEGRDVGHVVVVPRRRRARSRRRRSPA